MRFIPSCYVGRAGRLAPDYTTACPETIDNAKQFTVSSPNLYVSFKVQPI